MKTEHLHDLWAGPDNSRLTTKQFSFRFPVHIAAKLAALCELFPQKNRTQIVADLLTAALDDLEKSLPEGLGLPSEDPHNDEYVARHVGDVYEPLYHLGGARGRFHDLANGYFKELEKELGNENPGLLYPEIWVTESQFKK